VGYWGFLGNHGDQMAFQKPGFLETRAATQPETRHYWIGLLRLSQKARLPDGFPESRFPETRRKPVRKARVTEVDYCGFLGNHGYQGVSHSLF